MQVVEAVSMKRRMECMVIRCVPMEMAKTIDEDAGAVVIEWFAVNRAGGEGLTPAR